MIVFCFFKFTTVLLKLTTVLEHLWLFFNIYDSSFKMYDDCSLWLLKDSDVYILKRSSLTFMIVVYAWVDKMAGLAGLDLVNVQFKLVSISDS